MALDMLPQKGMSTATRAAVLKARDALVLAIRAHEPRKRQLELADLYIARIKEHARTTGRRLPVPNRYHLLRQLG